MERFISNTIFAYYAPLHYICSTTLNSIMIYLRNDCHSILSPSATTMINMLYPHKKLAKDWLLLRFIGENHIKGRAIDLNSEYSILINFITISLMPVAFMILYTYARLTGPIPHILGISYFIILMILLRGCAYCFVSHLKKQKFGNKIIALYRSLSDEDLVRMKSLPHVLRTFFVCYSPMWIIFVLYVMLLSLIIPSPR